MHTHLTRSVPTWCTIFIVTRLGLVVAAITAYQLTRPIESAAEPTRRTKSAAAPTFAAHAANIAAQSALVADLQDEEQGLLCDALTERTCDGEQLERCSLVTSYCASLAPLTNEIDGALSTIQTVYDAGYLELEAACDRTAASGRRLAPDAVDTREAYRVSLFAGLDAVSSLLRQQHEALDLLRAAARHVGGDALVAELEIDDRKERVRTAVDEILRSLHVTGMLRRGRQPPTDTTPRTVNGVRIPRCGIETQCWEL